jgi:hypothetical protein
MVSTDHFRQEIRSRFELASAQSRQDLTIECGELYGSVSKLPVFNPWMVFCCNAMRAEMALTDRLIFESNTSLLTICYALPRHQPNQTKPFGITPNAARSTTGVEAGGDFAGIRSTQRRLS